MTTMTAASLSPLEAAVLQLLRAHREVAQPATAAHRMTLEAYANAVAHAVPEAAWVRQAVRGGLRRQLVQALLDLRAKDLVRLGDAGFDLTDEGLAASEDVDSMGDIEDTLRSERAGW